MNENSQIQTCSHCGATVAPGALKGLCPRCLMALNLATQTEVSGDDVGPTGTQVVKPPPAPVPSPEEIARNFPQLEILECLGRGGMGVVYKARQPRLDRLVALKILTRDREDATRDARFAERFEREARALAKLSHPNIVAMYEFGQAEGLPYFIMEYVDGLNLRQLEQAGKLAPREALQIIPQICEALQFAHDEGIVHRDIKPENILLDKKGRVKIADFGIAKILAPGAQDFTQTGGKDVVGTPHYMAPEQVEKPRTVDHRADIYSLGVVFYEMLTGELPLGKFAAPSQKVQVDVRLDEVVLHALEKEPGRRYQHASDVKSAVETIAATPPPAADEPDLAEARGRVKTPGLGLCFIGAANTLFAVGLLLWLTLGALGASQQPGAFEHSDLKNTLLKLGLVTVPLLLVALVLGVLVVAGGWYMRRLQQYRLAVAASILAVFSPLGVLGLPISIWSMIVLMDPKVREAFATTKRGKADRRTEITPRLDPAQASQPRQEGWKAQLAVVGVRDGKRVVNWWRVATSSSLMVILFNTGALLYHFLSGHPFWSLFTLSVLLVLISATMSLAIYVGLRKQPIEQLVRLEEGWPGRGKGAGPRLSRTAVAGAVMAALSFLLPGLLYLRMQASIPDAATAGPLLWLLAGLLACATTMVGAVGVTQIRRSAGRIYGLGLAVFDGLIFPLLALDFLLWMVVVAIIRDLGFESPSGSLFPNVSSLLTVLGGILLVDVLIALAVWRAVNTPLDGMVPPSVPPKAGPPPRKGVGLLALALCLGGLALVLPLGWLRAHFESEEFLKLLSMFTEQRQTPSGVSFVLSPLFAILMCAFLYGCEIPALVLGLMARRGRAGKIAAFLAGAAILLPFGYFSWEWKETRRVLQITARRGIDPTPKLLDVGYEQAIASGPDLRVQVGPNRFVMKAVVRNDRGGALRFEDGRGNLLTKLDFKTNPQLVKQAEWLDLVNLSFGVDSSDPQPQLLYDLIEVRVFDHQRRTLLGAGEDRWGVGWDLQGDGLLQLRGAGQPLPDTVDVWFRAASHGNASGRIQLRPEAGAWTNVGNGRLTVREVRDGQWGYSLGGQIAWSNNPIRSPGCTVVLDWTGDGSLGRQQITVTDTAANQRQIFPPGAPHFLDFQRNGATQIIHFDVPLARVGQVELRPFGGRHTFYFDGVKLPKVSQRRLTLPPPLVLPLNGQAATVESQELDPVKVRVTTLSGRTLITSDFPLTDPALDATRYLVECGPAVQTNAYSTLLWRVEGLGRVPVGLTFLDHQGQRLNPGRPHQKAELSGVGPLATASAWAFAMPLAQAHTVLVQLGAAANHESTAPSLIPPSTPIAPITPPAGFGPVIERVIRSQSNDTWALNLTSGNLVIPTPEQPLDFRVGQADSLRVAKVDLYQPFEANTPDTVKALDMRLVALGAQAWDTPASEAIAHLEKEAAVQIRRSEVFLNGSAVYAFSTREGAKGVLQILKDTGPAKLRYKLLQPAATVLASPRELVTEWLRRVKAGTQDAGDLTTRSRKVGTGPYFTGMREFDRIRPLHQLGNEEQAMVVSNPFNEGGQTRIFYAVLRKRDGQWLVDGHNCVSPSEASSLMKGFSVNPGMTFDVLAAELVGEWRAVCDSTISMATDGTGKQLRVGPGGPEPGAKPESFKWEVSGSTLRLDFADRQEKLEILWLDDHDLQFHSPNDSRWDAWWRKPQVDRPQPAKATNASRVPPTNAPAQLGTSATPPLSFGSVIERVLDFDRTRKTAYLDLDIGEYVDPGTNGFFTDATPGGVDLMSRSIESNFDVRWAINMSVVPVEPMRWEATPEEIRMAVDSAKRQPKIRLGGGRSTNTWFFQTSEGGRGVLQFLPPKAGDDPSQVRLRYRLVEASSSQTDGPGAR